MSSGRTKDPAAERRPERLRTGELSEAEVRSGLYSRVEVRARQQLGGRELLGYAVIAPTSEEAERHARAAWNGCCTHLDPEAALPTVVAIAGEEQLHVSKFFRAWKAEDRGWQVVVPMRPDLHSPYLYEQAGARGVVDLIGEIVQQGLDPPLKPLVPFRVEGGKFHLIGTSNGGASVLAVAAAIPHLIASLTLVTGFVPPHLSDLRSLKQIRLIRLFVGSADEMGHDKALIGLSDSLQELGVQCQLSVLEGAGHFNIGHSLDMEAFWSELEDARLRTSRQPRSVRTESDAEEGLCSLA